MDALGVVAAPWWMVLAVADGGARPMTLQANALAGHFRLARQGDGAAFRRWVQEVTPTVYRLGLRMLGSREEAEEVVQETMIRAWQGMGDVKDPQASLGWACRVARNVAHDRGRSRSRGMAGHTVDLDPEVARTTAERLMDPARDPESLVGDAQARALVRAAMERLSEKHRLVLWLCDVDGMPAAEAAAALGVPEGTVDSRLHRARLALGKALRGMAARRRWWPW